MPTIRRRCGPIPVMPAFHRSGPPTAVGLAAVLLLAACSSGSSAPSTPPSTPSRTSAPAAHSAPPAAGSATATTPTPTRPSGQFTFAFAGDVNFADRTATRLAQDPATAFGAAAAVLGRADLTMVNLETAVTSRVLPPQNKSFVFHAPPSALTALRDAGVELATMANNHGADYGTGGLQDTLAAIAASKFPVIGIGANAAQAFAPYTTTINGVRLAVFAATQVREETLANFSAGPASPGVANAFSPLLVQAVRAAKAAGYVVVVYLHWGTEYQTCPNADQTAAADTLAAAGAAAVVGTHAHVLLGAGWRPDGTYVAYGLSNYLWWMSFGNEQDDNGVLTLTFRGGHVAASTFAPAHLDDTGVPVPAVGAEAARINAEWDRDRQCAGLSATPTR
jgi:Bacterial capsule synthesis protein PGA_cap